MILKRLAVCTLIAALAFALYAAPAERSESVWVGSGCPEVHP